MEEQKKKIRCVLMIALAVIVLQAMLPASFIGGMAGLSIADLLEHGSDLMIRIFVLSGMVLGLLVLSLITMLVVSGINALTVSQKTKTGTEETEQLKIGYADSRKEY